jgi:tRNA(Ile)-lysidine synthase TilS/MesJ
MKYAVHKFRSTIGKAHALKHNEHVLLAYSGGLSSGSMVKLMKEGLDFSESKKIKMVFKPTLVHIDGNSNSVASIYKEIRIILSFYTFLRRFNFESFQT